jgi:hypothetical protein
MPGFCVSCGTPLTGPFCNNCGARAVPPGGGVQATPAATPPESPASYQPVVVPSTPSQPVSPMPSQGYQPVQAPVTAVPKGPGLGKVLLWVGGIFLFGRTL